MWMETDFSAGGKVFEWIGIDWILFFLLFAVFKCCFKGYD